MGVVRTTFYLYGKGNTRALNTLLSWNFPGSADVIGEIGISSADLMQAVTAGIPPKRASAPRRRATISKKKKKKKKFFFFFFGIVAQRGRRRASALYQPHVRKLHFFFHHHDMDIRVEWV